jgi:hypothetical protein
MLVNVYVLNTGIVCVGIFNQRDPSSTETHERIFHQSSVTEIVPVKISQGFTIFSLRFRFTLDGVPATICIGKNIGSCPGI